MNLKNLTPPVNCPCGCQILRGQKVWAQGKLKRIRKCIWQATFAPDDETLAALTSIDQAKRELDALKVGWHSFK